jgi:hypothetical protein
MPYNQTRRGKADHRDLPARDPYEVSPFAKKHGIAIADAKRIINQHGSDRDSCDKAANRLK